MSPEKAKAIVTIINESEKLSARLNGILEGFLQNQNLMILAAKVASVLDSAEDIYSESIESIQPEGATEDDLPLEAS